MLVIGLFLNFIGVFIITGYFIFDLAMEFCRHLFSQFNERTHEETFIQNKVIDGKQLTKYDEWILKEIKKENFAFQLFYYVFGLKFWANRDTFVYSLAGAQAERVNRYLWNFLGGFLVVIGFLLQLVDALRTKNEVSNEGLIVFLPVLGVLIIIFIVAVLILNTFFPKLLNSTYKSLLLLTVIGVLLLFSNRMTEVSLGVLHAKLEQANSYLEEIKQIREQANQSKIQLESEIKKYTDYFNELSIVNELEASSLADNRQAFEELQRISSNGKYKTITVSNINAVEKQLEDIRNFMTVSTSAYRFSSDGQNYLPIELFPLDVILFQYFNVSGITLDQIIEAMKVINREIKKMPEQEVGAMFLKFLKHSKNLPASAAVCEILATKYSVNIDIFDFNAWIDFLNKKRYDYLT